MFKLIYTGALSIYVSNWNSFEDRVTVDYILAPIFAVIPQDLKRERAKILSKNRFVVFGSHVFPN